MMENRATGQYGTNGLLPETEPRTTGRHLVVFADDYRETGHLLASVAGLRNIASAGDFTGQEVNLAQTDQADALLFPELPVAVVSGDSDRLRAMQAAVATNDALVAVVPEYVHQVLTDRGASYVEGYRDGVADLSARLGAGSTVAPPATPTAPAALQDTLSFTWGLQATGVSASTRTGKDVKVAILDTGFDLTHPDFAGRTITSQSFVPGQTVQDGHGHGTHCTGTACGPKAPATTRRYGIAHEAQIFSGKVLGDEGSGSDIGILAGINWALTNGCDVISMSLGAPVPHPSPAYTAVGRRALTRGALIVAAAGNESDRRMGTIRVVGIPANSPTIMSVAALDEHLAVTYFSNRSNPVRGGQIDIAGPGLNVYSSWREPTRYRSISGTSMATPHVAGIAALWAQATNLRGRALWATLDAEAQRLAESSYDVAAGLATAPQ